MTTPRLKPEAGKIDRDAPVYYPEEDDEPLAGERAAPAEMERLLREHGIEPPRL